MSGLIAFLLSNFTLTFFVVGLVVAGVGLWVKRSGEKGEVWDVLLRQYLFWAIGVSYFYNFVMHVFFADIAAKFIGWANSPFQYEVGYASLGFAVVAFVAHRGGFPVRLVAVLGPALFMLGAAGGHVYQIVKAHNYAPGNAGIMLWSDILLPVIGFVLLWGWRRSGGASAGL